MDWKGLHHAVAGDGWIGKALTIWQVRVVGLKMPPLCGRWGFKVLKGPHLAAGGVLQILSNLPLLPATG